MPAVHFSAVVLAGIALLYPPTAPDISSLRAASPSSWRQFRTGSAPLAASWVRFELVRNWVGTGSHLDRTRFAPGSHLVRSRFAPESGNGLHLEGGCLFIRTVDGGGGGGGGGGQGYRGAATQEAALLEGRILQFPPTAPHISFPCGISHPHLPSTAALPAPACSPTSCSQPHDPQRLMPLPLQLPLRLPRRQSHADDDTLAMCCAHCYVLLPTRW